MFPVRKTFSTKIMAPLHLNNSLCQPKNVGSLFSTIKVGLFRHVYKFKYALIKVLCL